jgi:hypothetical protein
MNPIREILNAVYATRLIVNRNHIVSSATIFLISECPENKERIINKGKNPEPPGPILGTTDGFLSLFIYAGHSQKNLDFSLGIYKLLG